MVSDSSSSLARTIFNALLNAFPTLGAWEQLIRFSLDTTLPAITLGSNLEEVVYNVLSWADAHGRVGRLLEAARQENPDNPLLQALPPIPPAGLFPPGAAGSLRTAGRKVNQTPPLPRPYISRPADESALRTLLLTEARDPLTVLYGEAGTGKSVLASAVVAPLVQDGTFPDGVLWGDLENRQLGEQLRGFLLALGRGEFADSPAELYSITEEFHQALAGQRLLVVLDNVPNPLVLSGLLPRDPVHWRILVITTMLQLDTSTPGYHLDTFDDAQTLALFAAILGSSHAQPYTDELRAIGQQCDNLPELVVTVALDLLARHLSPVAYLQQINSLAQPGALAAPGLALSVQSLPAAVQELFALTGVFGEGSWQPAMLAAVAMQPLSTVRPGLEMLVVRDLIHPVGQRFTLKSLKRRLARQLFLQRDPYQVQAAYHLLARYCLDIIQDLHNDLAFPGSSPTGLMADSDNVQVTLLQDQLLPEMAHIRAVLTWAATTGAWDLLYRFAYLPAAGLIRHLVVNRLSARVTFALGHLDGLLFSSHPHPIGCAIDALINGDHALIIGTAAAPLATFEPTTRLRDLRLPCPLATGTRAEIALDLTACTIEDGIFADIDLINARWTGVRAPNLLMRGVDLVSAVLVACDLRHSLWSECDARYLQATRSAFIGAVLRRVRLRGASLSEVSWVGASLEDVDLRGADLHGADFTGAVLKRVRLDGAQLGEVRWVGAVLEDVSLHGADVHGSDFTGAHLSQVVLYGAQLEDTLWTGARLDALQIESTRWIALQGRTTPSPDLPGNWIERPKLRGMVIDSLGTGCDWRAAVLAGQTIQDRDLAGSWVQLANFNGARLANVNLTGARGRAADFRGAHLIHTILDSADLAYSLWDATSSLTAVRLAGTDLTSAVLAGVLLADADLEGARLTGACLRGAQLHGARLTRADLTDADLTAADLTGADLTGALAAGACWRNARVTDTQLAGLAQLGGSILPTGITIPILDARYTGCVLGTSLSAVAFTDTQLVYLEGLPPPSLEPLIRGRDAYVGCVLNYGEIIGPARLPSAAPADYQLDLGVFSSERDSYVGSTIRSSLSSLFAGPQGDFPGTPESQPASPTAELPPMDIVPGRVTLGCAAVESKRDGFLGCQIYEGSGEPEPTVPDTPRWKWVYNIGGVQSGRDVFVECTVRRDRRSEPVTKNDSVRLSTNPTLASQRDGFFLCIIAEDSQSQPPGAADQQAFLVGLLSHLLPAGATVVSARDSYLTSTLVRSTTAGTPIVRLGRFLSDAGQLALADCYLACILIYPALRFAELTGVFTQVRVAGADLASTLLSGVFERADFRDAGLTQARLTGRFTNSTFGRADLTAAALSGVFTDCDFAETRLIGARLIGRFVKAHFAAADFAGASLAGCSLESVDLSNALHLDEDQLRQAARLRGSRLPDGQLYDGRFDLAGDQADALTREIDLTDSASAAGFYGSPAPLE